MKKIICLIMAMLLMGAFLVSCEDNNAQDTATDDPYANHIAPKYADIDLSDIDSLDGVAESTEATDYVIIDVKDYGKIVVRLFPDVAPRTVENFKKLVAAKAYDGLIFHRVIDKFMVQGGGYKQGADITRDEPEDADSIKGEFTQNGFVNNLKHTRGVLSMARTNVPDSASNQFFICHKTSGVKHLDGAYAAFGYVVYGMDVVDAIAKVSTDSNDQPVKDVVISSVRFATVTVTPPATDSETTTDTDVSTDTAN